MQLSVVRQDNFTYDMRINKLKIILYQESIQFIQFPTPLSQKIIMILQAEIMYHQFHLIYDLKYFNTYTQCHI